MSPNVISLVKRHLNGPATMVVNGLFPAFMIGTILAMEAPPGARTPATFVEHVSDLAAAHPQFAVPLVVAWLFAVLFIDTKESSSISHPSR